MNPGSSDAAGADAAALAAAAAVTEEALALHRDALALIAEGWRSQSGCAAVDLLHRQCGDAAELVSALNGAAGEMRSLREVLEDGRNWPTDAGRDPGFARTAARLGDRPPARFEASVPAPEYAATPPVAQPATPPQPAWSLGSIPIPNLGGAAGGSLIGIAAQLADALSGDAGAVSIPDRSPDKPNPAPPDKHPVPRHIEAVHPRPVTSPKPLLVPESAPAPIDDAAPQAQSPELPLLAAERPPALTAVEAPASQLSAPPAPAPPTEVPSWAPPAPVPSSAPQREDPRAPCEIAADELPNVGE